MVRIATNIIFCLQVLLLFLLVVEDRIVLPPVLQVAGRMHPLILHLPIGMLILVAVLVLFGKKLMSAPLSEAVGGAAQSGGVVQSRSADQGETNHPSATAGRASVDGVPAGGKSVVSATGDPGPYVLNDANDEASRRAVSAVAAQASHHVASHHAIDNVIHFALLFSSLSASLAALFGFFLSLQGDYTGDAMNLHRNSGVILSWLCYALVLVYQAKLKRAVFISVGSVAFALLIVAGHSGSVLTHGENFLFEPLKGQDVVLTAENASAYAYAIEPIFEAKCFSCHNETKAKGKLVMTDRNRFMAGGENGVPWVTGNPEDSRMIRAFYLPLEHDEHMPPDGKPQLNGMEIAAIKAWIRSGADFDRKLAEFPEHDSLKHVIAALKANVPAPATGRVYAFTSAAESSVQKANTPFLTVAPLYQGSPALQADFYVRKGFDLKSLEGLTAVKDQLVSISLSKMPVTDKDLALLSKFTNLEMLNLNFTDVKGSGLSSLSPLVNLRSLSLASTGVRARDLDPVLKLPQMRHLFLWNTGVSPSQRDSIMQRYPALTVELTQFRDESVMRLNRPMIDNDGLLAPGSEITFRHPMTGVAIRYTTDGSKPDSVTGTLYDKPFAIDQTTVVKAVACKNGWHCSETVEQILFVKGISPIATTLLKEPDPLYPGEGPKSLGDGRKGIADVLREPSWLGYQKQPFEAEFRFTTGQAPGKAVVISYGQSIYSHCFPPQTVEVWGGNSLQSMKLIRKVNVDQPSNYVPVKVEQLTIPLDANAFEHYRIAITPLPKLPAWFSKKGEKGWFFVDEIFFY